MTVAPHAVFAEGRMTLGLVLPVRRDAGPDVDFHRQLALAARAEELGFAALWVRDVPLNGRWYAEDFGHLDPWVMLGALAARTRAIHIGTAATVLTLRQPLLVAKAAVSAAALSGARFVLGLGSGDREPEFAALGVDHAARRELFRAHWDAVVAALAKGPGSIRSEADYELRPAAPAPIPRIVVGSAGQTLEWIAEHGDGWATYHRPLDQQKGRYDLWRRAVERTGDQGFRSFSVANRIDLAQDAATPLSPIDLGYRGGSRALRGEFEALRDLGVHHLLLNIVPNGRDEEEVLEEIASQIIPALA